MNEDNMSLPSYWDLADEIKAFKIENNILKDKIKASKRLIKIFFQQHDIFAWKKKMLTSLNPYREFLLRLIRLQLGLLNKDVADCFDISPTKSWFIFTTWIKLLSRLLKNLVACLPREAIRDNFPEAFIKSGNNKYQVILDCADIFTEGPKIFDCKASTWSDYKHHNTIKFYLVFHPQAFLHF